MIFKENNKAIYLQIADEIGDGILEGSLPPDTRIPSVREYAATVEVNANTVMRSYDHLASHGIIYNKRGIGYFIAPDAVESMRRMRREELHGGELDTLFHRLHMLGITPGELASLYSDYCNENTNTPAK